MIRTRFNINSNYRETESAINFFMARQILESLNIEFGRYFDHPSGTVELDKEEEEVIQKKGKLYKGDEAISALNEVWGDDEDGGYEDHYKYIKGLNS